MTSQAIKGYTKKVIPKFILQPILKARDKKNIDLNFANFILDSAIEFSEKIHGDVSSFDNNLRNLIVKSDNNLNSMIQDILTAFMPDFKSKMGFFVKALLLSTNVKQSSNIRICQGRANKQTVRISKFIYLNYVVPTVDITVLFVIHRFSKCNLISIRKPSFLFYETVNVVNW